MREAAFLKQNADKWQRFEAYLGGEEIEADVLAESFIQLTDDLSYSRTFYPQSNTTRYLNTLTARAHQAIYRNRKEDRKRLKAFWTHELPGIIRASHRDLFYSFLIFSIAVFVGVISAANDDTFIRLILGDSYVNMTLENIKNNDPLAVYKKMNAIDMFLGITLNNIWVSFLAFVAGVLLSFGTGWLLLTNGIMLGAFHHFFYAKGLLGEALLTIWIHGTLEIAAIIVAGAAGLVIGNSLLFPGTYTRRQSFQSAAKRGVKLAVGLLPVFIVAGFLEGFVTRYTEMPLWLSLTIIGVSLLFVIYYFVVYPLSLENGDHGVGWEDRVSADTRF
jgi:uncharacterized membrane protein SpoIIM required for sporulation